MDEEKVKQIIKEYLKESLSIDVCVDSEGLLEVTLFLEGRKIALSYTHIDVD